MGDKSLIEWTDATWNPVSGCTKVSQGCKHCYAERLFPRVYGRMYVEKLASQGEPGEACSVRRKFSDVMLHPERLDQPLRWKRPRRIFVNSMSDLFHEHVPVEFIDEVFAVMMFSPRHTFQVLTKRPERMAEYMRRDPNTEAARRMSLKVVGLPLFEDEVIRPWPRENIWLGISVEDQATADERIPLLLQTPAAVRWISAEPLLGPIDFYNTSAAMPNEDHPWRNRPILGGIHWLVVGGESGPQARPMHPDWARSLRDQCQAAGVPFLFKQWGEWIGADQGACPLGPPESRWMWGDGAPFKYGDNTDKCPPLLCRAGKKTAGRLLDGWLHDEYPT